MIKEKIHPNFVSQDIDAPETPETPEEGTEEPVTPPEEETGEGENEGMEEEI